MKTMRIFSCLWLLFTINMSAFAGGTILFEEDATKNSQWHACVIPLGVLLLLSISFLLYIRMILRQKRMRSALSEALGGRIGVCNRAGKIYYFSAEDKVHASFSGENIRDIPGINYPVIREAMDEVFNIGKRKNFEYQYHEHKRTITIAPLGKRFFGQECVVWYSSDTRELQDARLRAEQEAIRLQLQDLLEEHNILLDNMPAYVFTKDIENGLRYTNCNGHCLKLLNCTQEEIIGKNDLELFGEEGKLFQEDDMKFVSDPYRQLSNPVIFHGADKKKHYGKFFRKVITTSSGKRLLFCMVSDITELEKYNRTLQTFLEQDKLQKQCFSELLLTDDFQNGFLRIARMLGSYLQSAAINISRYHSDGRPRLLSMAKWNSGGEDGKPCPYELLYEDQNPSIFKHLKNGGTVYCRGQNFSDINKYDACHKEIYEYFMRTNCKELLCIPIMRHGQFWGYVGSEIHQDGVSFGSAGERMMAAAGRMLEFLLMREESRHQLKRAEEEKQLILDILPIPVLVLSSEAKILLCNQAFAKMLDMPGQNLIGVNCRGDICGKECLPEICPLALTLQNRTEQNFEKHLRDHTYLVTTKPIWENGAIAKVIVVYIDLTEVTRSRELLRQALLNAQEAANSKSLFLATMSHEIRTPLNAVIGFSELLQDPSVPAEEQDDYLRSINFAGQALLHLINDILDLSKIEAGQTIITQKPLRLKSLFDELKSIFQQRVGEKQLEFRMRTDDLPVLMLDERHIRQILLNLLGNAIKFTDTGFISLDAAYAGGTLTVKISDSGCGISPQALSHVFEPFVQDDDGIRGNRKTSGTGLGLPIVKRLTEAMGGKVEVVSEKGKGSSFTIVIPDVQISKEKDSSDLSEKLTDASGSAATVMIIDDVAMNLKVLDAMLKKTGYRVVAETSPLNALKLLEVNVPDLILTDLWMPELNGAQLAAKIHENPAWRNIPIVAVTADNDISANFDTSLFSGILLKPVSMELLKTMVHKLTSK